jgi:DNA-directed RNA polymerase specialized sigma24 family protein
LAHPRISRKPLNRSPRSAKQLTAQVGRRITTMVHSRSVIDPHLRELFRAVATTGAPAWQPLVIELEPVLAAMAKRQPIGRLRDRDDSPREIVTRVLARLHAKDFAAIHKLCAVEPPPDLAAWLRVVVRRSAIDYMREQPEFQRGNAARAPRWVSLASFTSGQHAAADPSSTTTKRSEVNAFVRQAVDRAAAEHQRHGDDALSRLALEWKIERVHVRRVLARGEQYVAVLSAVLDGSSYAEIATKLGITRREVDLTVRYIEELLRARGFGSEPG